MSLNLTDLEQDKIEIVKTQLHADSRPRTLQDAFKATLQAFPDKQYTTTDVTRNNLVERTVECLGDECVNAQDVVKFIGKEAVDTGWVLREYFSELFRGISGCSAFIYGTYPNITFG